MAGPLGESEDMIKMIFSVAIVLAAALLISRTSLGALLRWLGSWIFQPTKEEECASSMKYAKDMGLLKTGFEHLKATTCDFNPDEHWQEYFSFTAIEEGIVTVGLGVSGTMIAPFLYYGDSMKLEIYDSDGDILKDCDCSYITNHASLPVEKKDSSCAAGFDNNAIIQGGWGSCSFAAKKDEFYYILVTDACNSMMMDDIYCIQPEDRGIVLVNGSLTVSMATETLLCTVCVDTHHNAWCMKGSHGTCSQPEDCKTKFWWSNCWGGECITDSTKC